MIRLYSNAVKNLKGCAHGGFLTFFNHKNEEEKKNWKDDMIDKLLNGTFVVSVNRKNGVIIARLDIDLFIRYQMDLAGKSVLFPSKASRFLQRNILY